MKFKHLIITRFLCFDNMSLGRKVLESDIINSNKNIFKKYLLPSLENQTNKNFTLIILIHNEVSEDFIKSDINTTLDIHFIKLKNFKAYLDNIYSLYDIVITTRIDHDDMIYKYAVDDVQKEIDINIPIKLYGYDNGLRYFLNDNKLFLYKNHHKHGFQSVFISLIVSTKFIKQNIYFSSHTKLKDKIKEEYKKINIKFEDKYIISNNIENAWIYVRHGNNDSLLINGKESFLEENIIPNLSKKEIYDLFKFNYD